VVPVGEVGVGSWTVADTPIFWLFDLPLDILYIIVFFFNFIIIIIIIFLYY
jgi:hypothetical protein